jgi:phosphatidylethanolamine/phosphatidyl-N-methylethanolamine N-methyltransferase
MTVSTKIRKRDESLLFLKQLIKNPKSLGAIAPSSPMLADFICSHVPIQDSHLVVEIGAGTGRFTQALLRAGVKPENLTVLEIDPDMCDFLKLNFPQIKVIQGDAGQLHTLLSDGWVGNVGTIISGIPMVNLSKEDQSQIISSCFNVLNESGNFLQFTYGPVSPLPTKQLGLKKKRLGHVFFNFPPATVWRYWKQAINSITIHDVQQQEKKLEKLNKIRKFVRFKPKPSIREKND